MIIKGDDRGKVLDATLFGDRRFTELRVDKRDAVLQRLSAQTTRQITLAFGVSPRLLYPFGVWYQKVEAGERC